MGIVGIEDPLRDEVPPAIHRCYGAGIDVRMCTGDNLATAVAIASRCGILRKEHYKHGRMSPHVSDLLKDRAMTGKEFRKRVHNDDGVFVQAAFDEIWPRLRVMARCDPDDKHTLAHGLNKSLLWRPVHESKCRGAPPPRHRRENPTHHAGSRTPRPALH